MFEIAGGIILAVLFFSFLPQIIQIAWHLLLLGGLILLICVMLFLPEWLKQAEKQYPEVSAIFGSAILALTAISAIHCLFYHKNPKYRHMSDSAIIKIKDAIKRIKHKFPARNR